MTEILLSIDSFQIRKVNELIIELENLCKENNLSKEETKLTLLKMFLFAYPTYEYETADKMERARLVDKIYKNIDNIKTNLNSFLYRKEEETELEATADNLEAPPAQIELENRGETLAPQTETKPLDNTQPNDNSSYLILPTRLLEALLKVAGNKKDNPHRMYLQTIGISTKNKMVFSTNGRIYLGLYDADFSLDINDLTNPNPQLIMPDVLLYAEDIKIFLKSLKTLATEDKKVSKNSCLLKYTPPAPDEETPTLTFYSSNMALQKEVLVFNDNDTSFMTYKFIETYLNVDYLNEHITDKNDAILDINYLTTLLDAYRKLTLNDYLDFSKFLHIEDKETDFKGNFYYDTDRSLIAGIACVRK